ncbi:hypothetical protein MAR_013340 [Mya arenaria]|uniref:Uncharacterized protein n=1 Tax=Mya arenaria TaxID=6604 RepID=A0ABY7G3M6_MYAAR|nr:hypothetical protein MAR_013340 [Mya arenaria]
MYPNRPGDVDLKRKPAETAFKMVVDNPEQLMDKLGLCDAKAAHYFGLLANGDCVSNEIAGKVSFSSRNLVLLNMDHYRPRVKTLHPSAGLGIPDEYTHYFINSYYTRAIDQKRARSGVALTSVTDEQKSGAWKQIALVQVRAKRMYNSNKRYRKFCRSTNDYRKYCLLENQTLKELKKTITRVHTMRRDWLDKPYEYQIEYINNTKKNLKLWNDRLRLVSKQLRKIIKKTKTKTLQSNTRLVLKS